MLKDKIMLGAIIGILANGVKLTANYIMCASAGPGDFLANRRCPFIGEKDYPNL